MTENFMRLPKLTCMSKPLAVLAAMALCAALSGYGGDGLAEVVADARAQSQTQAETALPDEFTTEGKPTETISTPSGAREIYDPTQDDVVRAAFKRIYDRNEGVVHREYSRGHPSLGKARTTMVLRDVKDDYGAQIILPNGEVQQALHDRTPDADDLIVMQALIERRTAYLDLKCRKVKESPCNQTHIYRENYYDGAPGYSVKMPAVLCPSVPVGGKRIYNSRSHPIGKQFFAMQWLSEGGTKPTPAPLEYEAQLENYFYVKCLEWGTEK